MELDKSGNHKALVEIITCQINESLCAGITFAQFMDLALYHPQYGYYATAPSKIGAAGDFFTSPHLGADFGELLAAQFVQMWQLAQQPDRFTLVEMGAGQGVLASDILHYCSQQHPEFVACLEYRIVERSGALRAEQRQRLQPFIDQGMAIAWCTLEDLAPDSVTGCFFSNELIDAFPVHQVVVKDGQLQELYVGVNADNLDAHSDRPFTEFIGPLSTPRLADYFDQVGIDLLSPRYPDGYRTEVNLAGLDWIAQVASCLHQGYVLTIDYGYTSDRYYNPVRSAGTLQCYYRHQHHDDPYCYVGQQDITAHVDFTALERYGEQCGLQTLGLTKQGLFLMSLGLGDRLATLTQSPSTDLAEMNKILRRRDALQSLINPMGLGNFGVLIQGKNLNHTATLAGLRGEQ